ncbi:hypothetical protein FF011L_36560 [Roseimaritima multifibrata]|uniref:Lipoprotein n=1 Tax=Roseimaritima multifibrata TaxID=1930274 RepID=A0A517MJ47_9BACT|nr:membrane or secreted protein [Roseimaritima multifibrata]QDS94874.1 hypothetical protein FF011L_36560 [Roseimaritima multifibrata]
MRKAIAFIILATMCMAGCAAVRDMLLPGNSASDANRRFWDQTSDNPYR